MNNKQRQYNIGILGPLRGLSMNFLCKAAILCACFILGSCGKSVPDTAPAYYGYKVAHVYYHDPTAFTQGLAFADGYLYESTGQHGKSSIRRVRLSSGAVEKIFHLRSTYFGEGLTLAGDRIIQLTWQSRIGFVYEKNTFKRVRTFEFPYEGWGIAFDGRRFIASDGSATLHFLDPLTFSETGTVEVTDQRGPVTNINELEYVRGEVFANIWKTDQIARIDPATGRITGWINLTGLLPSHDRTEQTDVLNGIAYDSAHDRLFVTGKNWPKLFEIKLVPAKER